MVSLALHPPPSEMVAPTVWCLLECASSRCQKCPAPSSTQLAGRCLSQMHCGPSKTLIFTTRGGGTAKKKMKAERNCYTEHSYLRLTTKQHALVAD